nr:SUMO-activating enzyme subunit 1 isoform X2 [Chrysemys picta bellii]
MWLRTQNCSPHLRSSRSLSCCSPSVNTAHASHCRLRASRVLLVGMKGLGAEVAKNLILAGVKGLTMLDHQQVSQEDTRAQFLIPVGSLGRNRAEASLERAQNLNPMVDVKADPENIENKAEDFFTQFDAVCLTCCSRCVMVKVDQICHKNGIKFFTGDIFGYYGYMFANLGAHEFVEEKTKVTKASQGVEDGPDTKKAKLDSTETTMVKKRVVFCQLKEALAVDWSSEKAKAALKRTAPDYFLLQGQRQSRSFTWLRQNQSGWQHCLPKALCVAVPAWGMPVRPEGERVPVLQTGHAAASDGRVLPQPCARLATHGLLPCLP